VDTVADRADLAVAIRTFTVTADATQLGVGAGITADSDPSAEWHETELKAARLLTVAGAGASAEPVTAARP
jgi:para-aminobenzoate synthetase component 1